MVAHPSPLSRGLARLGLALSLACLLPLSPLPLAAQEETAPAPDAPAPAAEQKPEMSPDFIRLYKEATQLLREEKYQEALAKLDEAEQIEANTNSMNLRGAIYTEMRDYENARQSFQKAVEASPDSFGPKFNLGEVDFLQRRYERARLRFNQLLQENDQNDLVRYKLYLTYLLDGDKDKARAMLGDFNFAGDMPGYYFAHAAWEFAAERPKVAYGWIGSATSIYPGQVNNLFADSLIELGWLDPNLSEVETELAPPVVMPTIHNLPEDFDVMTSPRGLPGGTRDREDGEIALPGG